MRAVWLFAFQSLRHRHSSIISTARRGLTNTQRMSVSKQLVIDPFCFRQFAQHEASKMYTGTIFDISMEDFENIVNERYRPEDLKDGYAPFCKHLFLSNDFTKAQVNVLPIRGNEHLVRTEYAARNDKELPILQRSIPLDLYQRETKAQDLPVAKYLDLILYSREQIQKENASMGNKDADAETAPWGIVSIKAQDVDYELPMNPITVMRNALGKEQGGSGIPLKREAYMEAVNYWKDHVVVS